MNWDWLGRRWKLLAFSPVLFYVVFIPISLVVYAVTSNIAAASSVLNAGLDASLVLGVALFFVLIALGAVAPIKNAPRVGLRHVFMFYAFSAISIFALYEAVIVAKQHALLTPQVAFTMFAFLGLTWSLTTSGLVAIGFLLHNHMVDYADELRRHFPRVSPRMLRGLFAVLIVVPAATVAFAYSITKSALDAGFISLTALVITMVIIFAIMYMRVKRRRR
jgi:hypothetical protein